MRRTLLLIVVTITLVLSLSATAHAQTTTTIYGGAGPEDLNREQPSAAVDVDVDAGSLARTGSDWDTWVRAGLVLLTVGSLFVLVSRKRSAVVREAT